jgi:recombinational DNA repair protein RecT
MDNQLTVLLKEQKVNIWNAKASYLNEKQDIYFKRALINIFENDDILALSQTEVGAKSILRCLAAALQMGLQIGGQIPQAYVVAMPVKDKTSGKYIKKATLIPTLAGYKFIALSDPPILQDVFISAAYEKETISINKPAGIVNHELSLGEDRGKLVGVYAILTNLNGTVRADWMSRKEIENVRNTRSPSYKAFLDKKLSRDNCTWETDFDQQAIKTAGKRFLKPYAALKEGLYMALACDEEKTVNPVEGDIEDRVGQALDNVNIIEVEPETEETEAKEETGTPEDFLNGEKDSIF